MIKARLFKIKKNKLRQWKRWCAELNTGRRAEAEKTLEEEKLKRELFFIFETPEADYALGFIEGDSNLSPANPDEAVNMEHRRQINECLEPLGWGEIGYRLGDN